jgi:hypothetical protein
MEALKQHLLQNPHLTAVYLNQDAQWQFFPRRGYSLIFTRDEVLAIADETASSQAPQIPAGGGQTAES